MEFNKRYLFTPLVTAPLHPSEQVLLYLKPSKLFTMKKLSISLLCVFCTVFSIQAQLYMDSGGDVKIGTHTGDPVYKLETYGSAFFSGGTTSNGLILTSSGTHASLQPKTTNTGYLGKSEAKYWVAYSNYVYYNILSDFSDLSIKENIRSIESPLSSICQIRGIQYDLKADYFKNSPEEKMEELIESGQNKYGVVAQELNEILPDLVMFNEDAQLLAVNYVGLIPILVEAIKEQQTQIDDLKMAVSSSGSLKGAAVIDNSLFDESGEIELTSLFQNSPNPFTEETTIKYFINENISSATIYVYDMTGKQLRNYKLQPIGNGEITINGGELDSGMYMYSLVADGQLIGTKQMVLTD